MEFIKAKPEDEAEILALYEAAKTSPYTTWNEYYPAKEEADADLAAGTLYVLKEAGAVIGAVSVAPENEIEDFSGWEFPEPAREIARVAVLPAYWGKGLAAVMVGELEKILKSEGCRSVRLLVAVKNPPACRTYEKRGFSFRGRTFMFGNDYHAAEKAL